MLAELFNFSRCGQNWEIHEFVELLVRFFRQIRVGSAEGNIAADVLHAGIGKANTVDFDEAKPTFSNRWQIGMLAQEWDVNSGFAASGKDRCVVAHHARFAVHHDWDQFGPSHVHVVTEENGLTF
jgi:hypothetical protein